MKRRRLMRYTVGWTVLSGLGLGSILFAAAELQNPEVQTPQSETAAEMQNPDAAGATSDNSTATETSTPEPDPELNIVDAAAQLRERINELRQEERDMDPLTQSSCAAQKAQAHAESMATNGYFSHTGRDGTTQTERYAPCGGGGENAAKTYVNTEIVTANGDTRTIETTADLVDSLMTQWMTSREHREKGIFGDWSAAGVGIARDGTEIYAVTGFIL